MQELIQNGIIDQKMASQVPRVFNADHAMQVYLHTIDADKALDRVMPAPAKPSSVGELIIERKALAARNPNDPNLAVYDAAINKATTHQPPIVDLTNKLETKESQTQGEYNVKDYFKPLQEESFSAQKRNKQLSILENINAKTGWGAGIASTAFNILTSSGFAPDAAKEYAGNAQKFTAIMQQMALETTQSQKGAQSEADSKRINSSMVQLANTPEANKFIISVAKAQNNQAIAKADFVRRYYSTNQTYQGAEDSWQEKNASKSLFDDPALSKYAKPSQQPTSASPQQPISASPQVQPPTNAQPQQPTPRITGHEMGNANLKTPVGAPPGTTWAGYAEGSGNRVWRFPDGSMHEEQ